MRDGLDYDLVYSKCVGIDANWLLTGDGEMVKKESTSIKQNGGERNAASIYGNASTSGNSSTLWEAKDADIETQLAVREKQVAELKNEVHLLRKSNKDKDKIIALLEKQNAIYEALERGNVYTKKSRQATESV